MSDDKNAEERRWTYEQKRAVAERFHDLETEFGNKANEAAVTSGTHAIRALLLINGGAVVAMPAFIGHVAGIAGGKFSQKLGELTAPLSWFAWGVAFAAAGTALAYFTNYCIGSASTAKKRSYDQPFITNTPASKRWLRAAIVFQCLAILVGAGALVTFLLGMIEVRDVIKALK